MILATVSPDPDFHKDVRASLDGHLRFEAVWDLGYEDAARLLGVGTDEKCLLILDFGDPLLALPVARAVDGRPQISSIAVKGGGTREEMVQLMQVGIRDVLATFTSRELRQAASRASAKLASDDVLGDLFAFLPAKPGCGASTIATYATAIASEKCQEATLLLDFDIRLGVTSFLLKAEGIHTIADALLQADHMDQDLWSSLVARLGNLHLLGSGPVDFSRQVPADRYAALLDFAVRRYSLISVDLPGTMEDCETEALMRAKRIFLVCTADIGALHVARRKVSWLQDLRLTDKVAVVLNSVDRRAALSVDDIQRIIQLPVRHMLPANNGDITRAVQKGVVLDSTSGLGKHMARVAAELTAGRPLSQKPNAVRRFVEYFSISAARDAS